MTRPIRPIYIFLGAWVAFSVAHAGPVPTVASTEPQHLTLADAYALAVTQSETIAIGAAEWQAAEARYRQARSEFRPELDLTGSLKESHVDTEDSSERTTRAGLRGMYEIFNGFRSTRLADARAAESEAYRLDSQRDRQLLFEDVADVFYQTLASENELSTLSDEIASLQERLDELTRRVKLGRSRPADVLSAQTQLADARVTLEQIRTECDASRELLAFLIGPTGASCVLVDMTELPSLDDATHYLKKLNERPDVVASESRVQAANSDAKAASSDRNVSATVDGNLYAVSDPGDSGDWDIGLTMTLPVFDGGLRRANVEEQRAAVRISELELAQLRRVADRDVRMEYRDVTGLLAQWAALQSAVKAAEESAAIQKKDYDMGRASNLDVISAMTELQSLRRRAAVLSFQTKAAMVRLHVAAGHVVEGDRTP